jgi:hypothetical protein
VSEPNRSAVLTETSAEIARSFDIEHVVIDDFRSNMKIYPPLAKFRRNQAITLRCDPYQSYDCQEDASDDQWLSRGPLFHPDLFLEIGWYYIKPPLQFSMYYPAWTSIGQLVRHFGGSRTKPSPFTRIVISPYLGQDGDDHRWCFGKNPPQVDASSGRPKIEFKSDCSCGNGDSSGCKRFASSAVFIVLFR